MLHAETKPGVICTFYSYKGGVGRSMALANVGALLARWGKAVLIVDWDLEAPGLEKFFTRPGVRLVRDTPGLVDLLVEYPNTKSFNWRAGLLRAPIPQGREITLLHAGRDEPTYLDKLNTITKTSTAMFEQGLGNALEFMRDEWRESYDFILLDSRTGITDFGGVCTILLPDYVLALFTANEQSLEGVRDTMRRVQSQHKTFPFDRQSLVVLPIPARDESNSEYERAAEWRGRFAAELEPFYKDWIPKEETSQRVLDYLKIPHVPFWSFGEQLPVLSEATDNPKNLAHAYALIARLINSHLDWGEVREGGRKALEAEAKQRAEVAEREAKAREIAALAQEAERKREEERIKEIRRTVLEHLIQLSGRIRLSKLRYLLLIGILPLLGILLIFLLIGIWLDSSLGVIGKMGWSLLIVPTSLYCLFYPIHLYQDRYLRLKRQLEALEQEEFLFLTGGQLYTNLADREVLRLFAARIEEIYRNRFTDQPTTSPPTTSSSPSLPGTSPMAPIGIPGVSIELNTAGITSHALDPTRAPAATVTEFGASTDVLIVYQPAPLTVDWVREFRSLLTEWLGELLGRDVTISELPLGLTKTESESAFLDRISQVRVALLIVSRRSVRSTSASQEIRQIISHLGSGRLIPVFLDRGILGDLTASEFKDLASLRGADFSDLAYLGEGFTKSERYLDFQDRIRDLAQIAAQMIERSELPDSRSPAMA